MTALPPAPPASGFPGPAPANDDVSIVPPGADRQNKRKRRKRLIIEWSVVLVVAAAVAIVLRAFVVQAFFVPSPSMVPTLQVGDRILVIKTDLLAGPGGRGSI